jgi:orotidine-5'-phosphate decarboxylase
MNNLVIALDGVTLEHATATARLFAGKVWGFKVNDLLLRYGARAISQLKPFGNVFADAKLHDIPTTVTNSIHALSEADLISVHASSPGSLRTACESGKKILAVTILTSARAADLRPYACTRRDAVVYGLAQEAVLAGVHGIVCSGDDMASLACFRCAKAVVGIRLPGQDAYDQASPSLPREADYLVLGRCVTEADDPLAALEQVKTYLRN